MSGEYAWGPSLSGLNPAFASQVEDMYWGMPADLRQHVSIVSGFRSPEHQARLYESALQRYGSEAEARRWVAPPGNSRHNYGLAVDFGWGTPEAREWVHANAGNFGLHFPMDWENWHLEPIGAEGGRVAIDGTWTGSPRPQTPPSVEATENPMMAMRMEQEERPNLLDPRAFMNRPLEPQQMLPLLMRLPA